MPPTLTPLEKEFLEAAQNMLENYLQLKRISLIVARSDRPNWMRGATEEDDIHVIAVRAAIRKATGGDKC